MESEADYNRRRLGYDGTREDVLELNRMKHSEEEMERFVGKSGPNAYQLSHQQRLVGNHLDHRRVHRIELQSVAVVETSHLFGGAAVSSEGLGYETVGISNTLNMNHSECRVVSLVLTDILVRAETYPDSLAGKMFGSQELNINAIFEAPIQRIKTHGKRAYISVNLGRAVAIITDPGYSRPPRDELNYSAVFAGVPGQVSVTEASQAAEIGRVLGAPYELLLDV